MDRSRAGSVMGYPVAQQEGACGQAHQQHEGGEYQGAGPGQQSTGLAANWFLTTGTEAIGCNTLVLQYWLPKAVTSSGAVSPEMRARASSTPVTMPALALR